MPKYVPTMTIPGPVAAPRRGDRRAAISAHFTLWQVRLAGSGLCAVIALAATFVSGQHGGPNLLYALLFGVAFHYLSEDKRTRPGIDFCGRGVLRLGVGLLGARVTASQIVALGWSTATVVILAVVTTILCGLFLARHFGLSRAQGVLAGGAVAICGASAALAISAVLPREKEGDRFTLMAVVTVTVLSTLAMIFYPLIAKALGLPPALAGLFIGATIHDVAQVVGAGYMLGQETGDIATVVKLFRVSLLAVVVLIVSAAFKRSRGAQSAESAGPADGKQPLVPWFLWMFVAMVVVNSLGLLSQPLQQGINTVSRACLVIAIAALGLKTSFRELSLGGWGPLALLMVETLWIAAFVVVAILLTR